MHLIGCDPARGPLFQIEMVLHRWEALSIKYKVTDQPYKAAQIISSGKYNSSI